jgi:hypothetical protein
VPNYKWKIMRLIIQYLMAQHTEICGLTFWSNKEFFIKILT